MPMYEHARKYGLTGTDAMVFEALCALCRKTGEWKGSFATLARYSCCGDRTTAKRTFLRLLSMGVIVQNAQNTVQIAHETVQIATNSKEERTKEENINNKKSSVVENPTTQHTTFSSFFNLFSPNGEYRTYEKKCKQLWETLPESWKNLAVGRAGQFMDRNPLFYLQDEDYLHIGEPADKNKKSSPQWLTGEQQDECLRAGIVLAVCRNPETGMFGTVTKEDADKFKLTILRTMQPC